MAYRLDFVIVPSRLNHYVIMSIRSWRDDEAPVSTSNLTLTPSSAIVKVVAVLSSSSSSSAAAAVVAIPPATFHKTTRGKIRDRLLQTLDQAANHAVREQRRVVSTQLSLKRSAYKELTSLQMWPLQDQAINDWNYWNRVHLGEPTDSAPVPLRVLNNNDKLSKVSSLTVAASSSSSSSSSSSCSEDVAKKRSKRLSWEGLSPTKSTLRQQYKQAFQQERDLNIHGDTTLFTTALYSMEPRIFCQEKSNTGQRKYWVGHVGRFMDHYWRKTSPEARHYYELIKEQTPCRLYFDLEFSKQTNPLVTEMETDDLMDEFYMELRDELKRLYNVDITRANIVDLESSTHYKFSRHWIVHLPDGALFRDNFAVGQFVNGLIARLAEEQATGLLTRPTLHNLLFVTATRKNDNVNRQVCFVDLGVYTRNRLFRLLGSCKFGKPASAALRIAAANKFLFPKEFSNASFYLPDMKQNRMASDADFDTKAFLSSLDFTEHAEALAATLVLPINVSKINFPILPDISHVEGESGAPRPDLRPLQYATRSTNTVIHVGASPFPCLDAFVRSTLATREGIQGTIRGWSVDYNSMGWSQCITYQMSRNRWCECIKRCHTSNNIMWTINLSAMEAIQSCHDPDCRQLGFRGSPVLLPEEVTLMVEDLLLEEQLAKMDLNELSKSAPNNHLSIEKQIDEFYDEFHDEEFEQALLAFDLSDKYALCNGTNLLNSLHDNNTAI